MPKLPINLKAIISASNLPDGRYRARVILPAIYPKDKQLGEHGEIPGETNDEGNQKYGWMRSGFRFTEHPSNYVPAIDGSVQTLAGDTFWGNFSFHPKMARLLAELYAAAGVDSDEPTEALQDKEVDIVVKNKARKDNPDVKEPQITSVRVAVG